MKSKKIIRLFMIIFLITKIISSSFCEDNTPLPYEQSEFPQGLKDLRRFEIITLGSLPFVTLDTTLVYSGIRYAEHNFDSAYTPNIFVASNYTEEEQKQIIMTSLGISVGIAITDYIIRLIKRSNTKKRNSITYDDLAIYPISEDPDATKIELPSTEELDEIPEVED